jgi:hypothetical protein
VLRWLVLDGLGVTELNGLIERLVLNHHVLRM